MHINHTEPVSLRAPAFANSAQTLVTFKHAISTTFSLPCEAQGSPAPIYRYFTFMVTLNHFRIIRNLFHHQKFFLDNLLKSILRIIAIIIEKVCKIVRRFGAESVFHSNF